MKGMSYTLKNRERNQTENIRHIRINFILNVQRCKVIIEINI
jgi:hypothetical protein